jgi:hypothetical protein
VEPAASIDRQRCPGLQQAAGGLQKPLSNRLTVVNIARLTPKTKGSPSIPARPHPLRNTGDFKADEKFVPVLKPRRRVLTSVVSLSVESLWIKNAA